LIILDPPRNLFFSCLWSRWLRESVGNLLALLPTAGELAGARELTFHGVRPGMAGASTVVDLTLEFLGQIAFTLIGLVLLFTWYQGKDIGVWLAIGIGVSIFAGFALHLIAWIVGAAEAGVALWYMGHALPWADVLILESVAFALRTATFIVPSRLGVQEGGYVVLGAIFGLTPDVALALSLLKRAREIVTGVPCLIIWQGVETRRLVKRSASRQ
jgi:hypothetical protein